MTQDKVYYDKDGDEIDLGVIYGVYHDRMRLSSFFQKFTNYSDTAIPEIVDYIIENVHPNDYNGKERANMQRQIESAFGVPDTCWGVRTASGMYQYCLDHNYGSGQTAKWAEKHFGLVERALDPDEEVKMCFIGLHNYKSLTKHDNNFAYAVTNKRVLMAQKRVIGEVLQSVSISQVNDVTFKSGLAVGILTIDTIKEVFNVALDKGRAKNISEKLHTLLLDLKRQHERPAQSVKTSGLDTDQLLKLKELLDAGVLTQDEFNAKKKQLLGI